MASQRSRPVKAAVVVEIMFGSEFQRGWAMGTLRLLLAMWQREVEGHHRDTKVTVTEFGEDCGVLNRIDEAAPLIRT
jgi:hypothetical protein